MLADAIDPGGRLPAGLTGACRPLVTGLLALLADPRLGVHPGSPRHAWAQLDLLAPVPEAVALDVRSHLSRGGRLGAGTGLWIDVDVDGPDGPLVRSRHVAAARTIDLPDERNPLPPPPTMPTGETDRHGPWDLRLDVDRVAAYRTGAADTSEAHADGPEAIVPGLLVLTAAVAAVDGIGVHLPVRLSARFVRPLRVGRRAAVTVASDGRDGHILDVTSEGGRVLRHGHVAPLRPGPRRAPERIDARQ